MLIDKKKTGKFIGVSAVVLGAAFAGLSIVAKKKKAGSVYDNEPEQKNPLAGKKVIFVEDENDKENADGVKGHLEAVGDSDYVPRFYEKYVKRGLDITLSFCGLIALAPLYGIISLAIILDDPGPILFTQKRLGQNKEYFKLHKFRSMKMSTPHEVPTHMLDKPEQYITKVGKFLRKHSLDELPQIWDIFVGNMSVIGPRPGLWNQDVLTAERDKYGANDVKPGLTGLAQINGRDELEIADKAKLDGEYVKHLGLGMDIKCFLGSLHVFGKDESVVEGGTGETKKKKISREKRACRHYADGKSSSELIGQIGFSTPVTVDRTATKKVLIAGAGSYIGDSFKVYAEDYYKDNFKIDAVDMLNPSWRETDFSQYDIVYHVAGIAHADVGSVDDATKEKYYAVNTDLAVEVCRIAKEAGVKEFIFMSSMIVYGESAGYGKKKVIDRNTVPGAANFYGDSKLQADVAVRGLADENFTVIVLRPPMIYGRGSKGNYPMLAKLAKKLPVFPDVNNERSMLHIDNLCEFLCQVMLVESPDQAVVLIPQNGEWTKTSEMVQEIAKVSGKKIRLVKAMKPAVALGGKVPGKAGGLVNKAFGSMTYDQALSVYPGLEYQVFSLEESILHTEGTSLEKQTDADFDNEGEGHASTGKHILVVSQYFYPESFRINDMTAEWVKRGYKVTVITGIPNYPMGKFYDGYGYCSRRKEIWNGVEIIRIPLIARGHSSIGMMANYVSFTISGFIKNLLTDIKADYVFTFEVSPMTQALIGVWYAKKHHVPHYLYVQDLWPENVETVTGIHSPWIIKPIDKMVDYIYKNTDEIFATSPSFVDAICNRMVRVPKRKVHYWPQYAEEFYRPMDKMVVPEIPADDSFKIAFTGNIGTAQGLDILPKTAALLKDENVKFVIVGDGRYQAEFEKEIAKVEVIDKFVLIPRQPAERIPELLAACDAAFLSFMDTKLFEMTIPAKLQSYMACGKPIIASAAGETERIIREARCGICCKIGDEGELAGAVREMISADFKIMGKRSRQYFEQYFDKKKIMDKMDLFLEM